MSATPAIEREIASFQDLHERFGLARAMEDGFFLDWQDLTVAPSASRIAFLDRLQQRYHYYYNSGILTEGTVLLSIVAPLLEHLGFHEPPFFVRSEIGVQLTVQERDEIYRGRIDVLVVREQLWVLAVETKRFKFAADVALTQCLAYMAASGQGQTFGLVTNGSDFVFCKLKGETYDFSEPFSLLSRQNRLYEVAEILERLKGEC